MLGLSRCRCRCGRRMQSAALTAKAQLCDLRSLSLTPRSRLDVFDFTPRRGIRTIRLGVTRRPPTRIRCRRRECNQRPASDALHENGSVLHTLPLLPLDPLAESALLCDAPAHGDLSTGSIRLSLGALLTSLSPTLTSMALGCCPRRSGFPSPSSTLLTVWTLPLLGPAFHRPRAALSPGLHARSASLTKPPV